jgi:hypothetical protein
VVTLSILEIQCIAILYFTWCISTSQVYTVTRIMSDLSKMSVHKLRQLCEASNISATEMREAVLVASLREVEEQDEIFAEVAIDNALVVGTDHYLSRSPECMKTTHLKNVLITKKYTQ